MPTSTMLFLRRTRETRKDESHVPEFSRPSSSISDTTLNPTWHDRLFCRPPAEIVSRVFILPEQANESGDLEASQPLLCSCTNSRINYKQLTFTLRLAPSIPILPNQEIQNCTVIAIRLCVFGVVEYVLMCIPDLQLYWPNLLSLSKAQ